MSKEHFYDCLHLLTKSNDDKIYYTNLEKIKKNINEYYDFINKKPIVFPISGDLLLFDTYKCNGDTAWNYALVNIDVLKYGAEILKNSDILHDDQIKNIIESCKNIIRFGIEPNLPKNILHKNLSLVNIDIICEPRNITEWILHRRRLFIITRALFYLFQLIHLRRCFNGPYIIEGKLSSEGLENDESSYVLDAIELLDARETKITKDMPNELKDNIIDVIGECVNCDVTDIKRNSKYQKKEYENFDVKKFLAFSKEMLFNQKNNVFIEKNNNIVKKTSNNISYHLDILIEQFTSFFAPGIENTDTFLFKTIHKVIQNKAARFGKKDIAGCNIYYKLEDNSNALKDFADIICDFTYPFLFTSMVVIRQYGHFSNQIKYKFETQKCRNWCNSVWERFIKIRKPNLIMQDLIGYLSTKANNSKENIYAESCVIFSKMMLHQNYGILDTINIIRRSRFYKNLPLKNINEKNNWIGAVIVDVIKTYLENDKMTKLINELNYLWKLKDEDRTIYVYIISSIICMKNTLANTVFKSIYSVLMERTIQIRNGSERYDICMNIYMFRQLLSSKVSKRIMIPMADIILKPIIDIIFHLSYYLQEECRTDIVMLISQFLSNYKIDEILEYLDAFSCIKFMNDEQRELGHRLPFISISESKDPGDVSVCESGVILKSLERSESSCYPQDNYLDDIGAVIFTLLSAVGDIVIISKYFMKCLEKLVQIFEDVSNNNKEIHHNESFLMKMIVILLDSGIKLANFLKDITIEETEILIYYFNCMINSFIRIYNYPKYYLNPNFIITMQMSFSFLKYFLEVNQTNQEAVIIIMQLMSILKTIKSTSIDNKTKGYVNNLIAAMKKKKCKDKNKFNKAIKGKNGKKLREYQQRNTIANKDISKESDHDKFTSAVNKLISYDMKIKKEGLTNLLEMIGENTSYNNNLLAVSKNLLPILFTKQSLSYDNVILINQAIGLYRCIGVVYTCHTIDIFIRVLRKFIREDNPTHPSILMKLQHYITQLLSLISLKSSYERKSEILRLFIDVFKISYNFKGHLLRSYSLLFYQLRKICEFYDWYVEDIVYEMIYLVKDCLINNEEWEVKLQALKTLTAFQQKSNIDYVIYSDDVANLLSWIQVNLRESLHTNKNMKCEVRDHCEFNINSLGELLRNFYLIEDDTMAKHEMLSERLRNEIEHDEYISLIIQEEERDEQYNQFLMVQQQHNLAQRKEELLANKEGNQLYDDQMADMQRDEKTFALQSDAMLSEQHRVMAEVHDLVLGDLHSIKKTGNVIIMMNEDNNNIHNRK